EVGIPAAGARRPRTKAALRLRLRQADLVRDALPESSAARPDRPRGAFGLSGARLRSGASHDLERGAQAALRTPGPVQRVRRAPEPLVRDAPAWFRAQALAHRGARAPGGGSPAAACRPAGDAALRRTGLERAGRPDDPAFRPGP